MKIPAATLQRYMTLRKYLILLKTQSVIGKMGLIFVIRKLLRLQHKGHTIPSS